MNGFDRFAFVGLLSGMRRATGPAAERALAWSGGRVSEAACRWSPFGWQRATASHGSGVIQFGLGLGTWPGEQGMRFGSAFDGARFDSVRTIADAVRRQVS